MLSKSDLINRHTSNGVKDWKEYHNDIETRKNDVVILELIQSEDYSKGRSPGDTVASFVEAVGYEKAAATIATLINRSSWDGRISGKNTDWAKTIDNALDEKAAVDCDLYADGIHMTHLDQIADKVRRYTPALEAAEKTAATKKPAKEVIANGEKQRKRTSDIAR